MGRLEGKQKIKMEAINVRNRRIFVCTDKNMVHGRGKMRSVFQKLKKNFSSCRVNLDQAGETGEEGCLFQEIEVCINLRQKEISDIGL